MNTNNTDMEKPDRYSRLADPAEVAEIDRVMSRMMAGGFHLVEGKDGEGRKATTELPRSVLFALSAVAVKYGLDPIMREVYILGDTPYVSTKALLRRAVEQGAHVEYEFASAELRANHQVDDDEVMAVATVWLPGRERPIVGYGYACPMNTPLAEVTRWEGPQGNRKKISLGFDKSMLRRIARTRAFRDALGMAYGANLADADDPRLNDIGTQTAAGVTATPPAAMPATPIRLPEAQVVTQVIMPPATQASPAPAPAPTPAVVVPPPAKQPEPAAEPEPAPVVEPPVAAAKPKPKASKEPMPEPDMPVFPDDPGPEPTPEPAPAPPAEASPWEPLDVPVYQFYADVFALTQKLAEAEQTPDVLAHDLTLAAADLRSAIAGGMFPMDIQNLPATKMLLKELRDAGTEPEVRKLGATLAMFAIWAGRDEDEARAWAKGWGCSNQGQPGRNLLTAILEMKTDDERRLALHASIEDYLEAQGGAA